MMMKFFGSWGQKPYLAWTFINVFILFRGITGVNGQAFNISEITLSRPTSSVGATLQARCNATYLASTAFVLDWRINNTVVGLYLITNNMVPQLGNGSSHQYDVVFSTVTTTVHTGDTFEVILEIRNLKLNDDQTAISVTCTNCVQVRTLINVEECQLDNSNGVIASNVVSPCGLGCQVQYSCKSGYTGPIIIATCLADATFDATPLCVQSNIDTNSTLIILPTNQATIATEVTGLIINSGDILSPSVCSWTVNPGLRMGVVFYQPLFGGCYSFTTTNYSISCSESSGVVSSNFTFLTPLTSNVNISMDCSPSPRYNLQVIVKDCTSPTPSNVPVNPPTGVYNTPAHFQCSQNCTLFYSNGTIGNTATKCLVSAEWENEKIVQCWSAPTATLIGNNTHCVGDKAIFQCDAVGGFPLADRVEVYYNGQIQELNGNIWTSTALNSSNNGDIVECRAISNYTSIAEYSHLGRDKNTLTVYYSAKNPKIENKMSDLLIRTDDGYLLRSDGTLTMNCSADGNPAVYCSWSCSSCVGLSNTCGVTNVGVSSSTDITCMVGNGVCGNGSVSISQRITLVTKNRIPILIVNGSPTTASVITRNKTQSLSLGCGIESQTEMKTTLLWVKDGEVKSGSNNLMINNLTSLDTGLYSCYTTDAFGNFSSTIYLDVLFPAEQFEVINGFNNVCEWITGGPQWCSITFTLNPILHSTMLTKDGWIVQNDFEYTQQNTMIHNFVFIKNQASENETGSYTLTVASSRFEPVDFSFTIIVSQSCQACDQSADSVVIVGSVLASIIVILLITNTFFIYQFCRYRNVKSIAEDRKQGNINSADADYVELDDAMRSNKISQQNITQQQHPYVNTGASVNTNDQRYMDILAVQLRNAETSSDGYEVVMNRNYENMGADWRKEGQSEYEI